MIHEVGSQSFLSQSFCSAEKNSSEKADKFSASRHVQLSKALEVLNLNPTQFHAIQAKPDKLKHLLEKTVKSRTIEFRIMQTEMKYMGLEDDGTDDLSKITDESTLHEAYQFLVKTYVEERKEKMKDSSMFLDMDVLKKRNDRRKSMVNLGDGDASPGNPSSRRGSFVKTKEEPVKDMKAIDQERRQAKKDAKLARRKSMCIEKEKEDEEMKNDPAYMLFMDAEKTTDDLMTAPAVSPNMARRGSVRRKSMVPELDALAAQKVSAGVIKRRRRRRGSEDSDEENPEAEGEVKEGKEGGKEGKGKGKGKKKEKMGLDDPEKLRKRGNKLNKSQRKKSNPKKKEKDEEYGEDIDAQVNAIFSAVR